MWFRNKLAFALLAFAVACGGVNTSKNQRGPDHSGSSADDSDSKDGGDIGPTVEHDDAAPPEQDPEPSDAGTTEAPDSADAAQPVPPGSFAAGTELETTDDLNLRQGAGTQFPVIVVMPAGSRVKVETTSGADGWVNVSYNGQVGYCSKTYVKAP